MSLLILYNASGNLLGHATYAYHHLAGTPGKSCSACSLTHGPKLSLGESQEWKDLSAKISKGETTGQPLRVKQLHKDEMDDQVSRASVHAEARQRDI